MGKGGGNDGGVIATKRYLITTAALEKKPENESARSSKLTSCTLSAEPLGEHIVVDELGNLFNKDAVIMMLLERRSVPELSHIKSLKRDVVDVHAVRVKTAVEGAANTSRASGSTMTLAATPQFLCPVTSLEATGRYPFLVMRTCGCLVSERAVKAMAGSAHSAASAAREGSSGSAFGTVDSSSSSEAILCPACGTARSGAEDGMIKVAPTEDELDGILKRLAGRSASSKSSNRCRSGTGAGAGVAAGPVSSTGAALDGPPTSSREHGLHAGSKRAREVDVVHGNGQGLGGVEKKARAKGLDQGHPIQPTGTGLFKQGLAESRLVIEEAIHGRASVSAAVNSSVDVARRSHPGFAGLFHANTAQAHAAPSRGASHM